MGGSSSVGNVSETSALNSNPRSARGSSDLVWAYTILRLLFGVNIMLHGLSRLIGGRPAFLAYLTHYFEKTTFVPPSLLSLMATVLPWVETTLGLLLLIGLGTRFALIAGGLVLTVLAIGSNLAQDWGVAGLQLIYAFIYYYLLAHLEQNRYSVDALLGR